MSISSWDAAGNVGVLLGIDGKDALEMARSLIPSEHGTDLHNFVMKSADGFDAMTLLRGAMISSIIMERVSYTPIGDKEVAVCIICGNHKPVPATAEDEFGWVCSDCTHIYEKLCEMEMMNAMRRGKDIMKAMHDM